MNLETTYKSTIFFLDTEFVYSFLCIVNVNTYIKTFSHICAVKIFVKASFMHKTKNLSEVTSYKIHTLVLVIEKDINEQTIRSFKICENM